MSGIVRKLSNAISQKWLSFCDTLNLLDKNGNQIRNVSYLLDFAGYKEVEEKLIAQGEDIYLLVQLIIILRHIEAINSNINIIV